MEHPIAQWREHLTFCYDALGVDLEKIKIRKREVKVLPIDVRRSWARFTYEECNQITAFVTQMEEVEDGILERQDKDERRGLQEGSWDAWTDEDLGDHFDLYDNARRMYEGFRHVQIHIPSYPRISTRYVTWIRKKTIDKVFKARVEIDRRRQQQAFGDLLVPKKRRKLNDMRSDVQMEKIPEELVGQGWNGGWMIGRGGQGFANLYVQLDSSATILDRRVVKDTYMDAWQWMHAACWFPDVYDSDSRKPVEVKALEVLRDMAGDFVVSCTDAVLSPEKRMYRIFLEYCSREDLAERVYFCGMKMPEPFIWYVFESLVRAAIFMEQSVWDAKAKKSLTIVHRDIKPGNIFLTDSSTTSYPCYPRPKLADFGIAIVTSEDDPFNPLGYHGSGTKRFRAPEQISKVQGGRNQPDYLDPAPQPPKLDSWTNVWGIGRTIFECMNQEHKRQWDETTVTDPDDGEDFRPPVKDRLIYFPDRALSYSQGLRDLVIECLEFDPQDRPSLQILLDKIQNDTGLSADGRPDLAEGMRNAQDMDDVPERNVVNPPSRFNLGIGIFAGSGYVPPGVPYQIPGMEDDEEG